MVKKKKPVKTFLIRYVWEGSWVVLEIWVELFFFMEIKRCPDKGGATMKFFSLCNEKWLMKLAYIVDIFLG